MFEPRDMWIGIFLGLQETKDLGLVGPNAGNSNVLRKIKERIMTDPIMKYFEYAHLPEHLQRISAPLCSIAQTLDAEIPDGPEKVAGLRKLLEAKDCFVRATLP